MHDQLGGQTPHPLSQQRCSSRRLIAKMSCWLTRLACVWRQFDTWFPLFGVISVAIFSLYLLFCVVAGNFKFGMRFLCITLHPMKINGTYMNSFMFNLILILLSTFPVIEFCAEAFAGYARFSNIYQFFGVQMKYLIFFS
jgi:LMBR1 domain-containing protein 1